MYDSAIAVELHAINEVIEIKIIRCLVVPGFLSTSCVVMSTRNLSGANAISARGNNCGACYTSQSSFQKSQSDKYPVRSPNQLPLFKIGLSHWLAKALGWPSCSPGRPVTSLLGTQHTLSVIEHSLLPDRTPSVTPMSLPMLKLC